QTARGKPSKNSAKRKKNLALWERDVKSAACGLYFGCQHELIVIIICKIKALAIRRIEQISDLSESVWRHQSIGGEMQFASLFFRLAYQIGNADSRADRNGHELRSVTTNRNSYFLVDLRSGAIR